MNHKFDYSLTPTNGRNICSPLNKVLNESNKLNLEGLNEGQSILAEKIKDNSEYIPKYEEYNILSELAAFIPALWKQNKTLKIYFFEGDETIQDKIIEIASEWSAHCNINFEKTTNRNESHLRIAFENGKGFCSYIGTYALSVEKSLPTMNLEMSNIDLNSNEFKRLTLHEFGHALGLVHEHQRPDANIEWNENYINAFFKLNFNWDDSQIKINLYDVYETEQLNQSEIDSLSIMAYHVPKEFIISGHTFPLNFKLSIIDKEYIGTLYPISPQQLNS